jgi:hypothetical protein
MSKGTAAFTVSKPTGCAKVGQQRSCPLEGEIYVIRLLKTLKNQGFASLEIAILGINGAPPQNRSRAQSFSLLEFAPIYTPTCLLNQHHYSFTNHPHIRFVKAIPSKSPPDVGGDLLPQFTSHQPDIYRFLIHVSP